MSPVIERLSHARFSLSKAAAAARASLIEAEHEIVTLTRENARLTRLIAELKQTRGEDDLPLDPPPRIADCNNP